MAKTIERRGKSADFKSAAFTSSATPTFHAFNPTPPPSSTGHRSGIGSGPLRSPYVCDPCNAGAEVCPGAPAKDGGACINTELRERAEAGGIALADVPLTLAEVLRAGAAVGDAQVPGPVDTGGGDAPSADGRSGVDLVPAHDAVGAPAVFHPREAARGVALGRPDHDNAVGAAIRRLALRRGGFADLHVCAAAGLTALEVAVLVDIARAVLGRGTDAATPAHDPKPHAGHDDDPHGAIFEPADGEVNCAVCHGAIDAHALCRIQVRDGRAIAVTHFRCAGGGL